MSQDTYYSIITQKKRLNCSHIEWLQENQKLYNEVLLFYYKLFLNQDGIQECNEKNYLRELERLTIMGRSKEPVPYPLPWNKIPLYFRRSAINAAIAAGKSYMGNESHSQAAAGFTKSVTFYKGMYRGLCENKIELKIWNGTKWIWISCRLSGQSLPEDNQILSPAVVLYKNYAQLHVPVKQLVQDGRKAKERFAQGVNICCVQFTNEDALAACVILNREGNQQSAFFIRGGSEYVHRCKVMLQKIEVSKNAQKRKREKYSEEGKSQKITLEPEKNNYKYWLKLKNISQFYSNNISRQIINKTIEMQADIIILPKYEVNYTRYVMNQSGKWSPLYLSYKIREQLKNKAWREGILVLEVNPRGSGQICSACGAPLIKEGQQFSCKCGNCGNRSLNGARNLGKICLESFAVKKT